MQRIVVRLAGESGTGLVSVGDIASFGLKRAGYYVVTDREFPSLIKGGRSNFQINFSDQRIYGLSKKTDVCVAFDREGLEEALEVLNEGDVLIHGFERMEKLKGLDKKLEAKGIKIVYLPARTLAIEEGGSNLMTNMVLLGMLWKVLDLELSFLEDEVKKVFASKPQLLEIDLRCVKVGYQKASELEDLPKLTKIETSADNNSDTILLDGNTAIGVGAVNAGVRAYYAYPMSPASSVLSYLSKVESKTGMLVKQVEDEITAVQMATGSMYAGTRSFTATSGGGFDLMVETISLIGIIESPLVIVLAQRPGPATGLPTWTGQADVNIAIHSGHGEFARIVLSVSDVVSSFEEIQHAFNLAEKYQTLAIVLTEKAIADGKQTVPTFDQNKIEIERGLVEGEDLKELKPENRYEITESGVSKRWIPGTSEAICFTNGDEHHEDGSLDESEGAGDMIAKRFRKLETIKKDLPEPVVYGEEKDADISFVCFGSTKNPILDAIEVLKEKGIKANVLHYTYLWPLKTDRLNQFFEENKNVYMVEGNIQSQLGTMIEDKTNNKFKDKFLKWNGRVFDLEDILGFAENALNKN